MLQKFLRAVPPHARVGLTLAIVGLSLSLASTFRSFGWDAGQAQFIGTGAALLVGVGVFLLLRPKGDERVTWSWEMALLRHALGGIATPLLCRRHFITRAQGRLLACGNAKRVRDAIEWMQKTIAVAEAEMKMEGDAGMRELLEHLGIVSGLHKTIGAVQLGFIGELEEIEAKGGGSPELQLNVRAILENIRIVQFQLNELGVNPLDELYKKITECLKATNRDWAKLSAAEQGEIRGVLVCVKKTVQTQRRYVTEAQKSATRYFTMVAKRWDDEHEEARRDAACSPQDKDPIQAVTSVL